MKIVLNFLLVRFSLGLLFLIRLVGLDSTLVYSIWGFSLLQPWMEQFGRRRAFELYRHARAKCPAYKSFLEDFKVLETVEEFQTLPITGKDNYVKKYSIEQRCYGGTLPKRGVVIDESSGSSGIPNNWARGPAERNTAKRLIQHAYKIRFGKNRLFLLNCFALGPWATGMNVSMSLVDLGILKSIGPEKLKVENTLKLFGNGYTYVLAGYPPFFRDWFSTTTLDLSSYRLHLIVGGEGMSEGLRDFFLKSCQSVISSYGASDLEINIGSETKLSIALRKSCQANPELSQQLFGREDAPMIFQYNPVDYLIENSDEGEIVATILRLATAAPKIRYNIRDLGGSISHRAAMKIIRSFLNTIKLPKGSAFPFLFVYGRNDLSVPFYGSKVFSTDLDRILNESDKLRASFSTFQLSVREETTLHKTLLIDLERNQGKESSFSEQQLSDLLFVELQRVNQDFREVSKLFGAERISVSQFDYKTGPFEAKDNRIKNRYVAS